MKSKMSTLLLLLVFIIGLSLLAYPTVSDYWNSLHQSRAIASYAEEVKQLDEDQNKNIWDAAVRYNEELSTKTQIWKLNDEELALYGAQLDVCGNGIMGYIEIPSINCSLPIYHGTSAEALQIAAGHIEGSSLPVGGASTHSVISGHRGLPSAELFTNLDQMAEGDVFMLCILDRVLTYEVYQISTVEPEDVSQLTISAGEDLCTLVTCTPYGVNTHRLLVKARRTANAETVSEVRVVAEAMQIEPIIVASVIAVPMLLLLLLIMLIQPKKRKQL